MTVCYVDSETLGLDADVHPIWEVGLITELGEEHCWQLQITQREIDLAHPKALEISGFHERYDRKKAIDPWEFCLEFDDLTKGVHLVGAVILFDEERLRRMFWKEGMTPSWHYHVICVEALAVGYLCGSFVSNGDYDRRGIVPLPWNSKDLSRRLGVDPDQFEEHTALGDARWARAIYEKVVC